MYIMLNYEVAIRAHPCRFADINLRSPTHCYWVGHFMTHRLVGVIHLLLGAENSWVFLAVNLQHTNQSFLNA